MFWTLLGRFELLGRHMMVSLLLGLQYFNDTMDLKLLHDKYWKLVNHPPNVLNMMFTVYPMEAVLTRKAGYGMVQNQDG